MLMLSDLDCAKLCSACYNAPNTFDRIVETSGVWAGIKHYQGYSAIALRGSTTLLDWLRDFQGIMVTDPQLGTIEQGFLSGMRDVFAHVADEIAVPKVNSIYITGHSLGAARAIVLAGLLVRHNVIARVVTFGPPRPGGQKLKDLLAAVPISLYRNRKDPVCDVPFFIPNLFPYMHVRNLIPVDVAPGPDDAWGPVADHHIELYEKALST